MQVARGAAVPGHGSRGAYSLPPGREPLQGVQWRPTAIAPKWCVTLQLTSYRGVPRWRSIFTGSQQRTLLRLMATWRVTGLWLFLCRTELTAQQLCHALGYTNTNKMSFGGCFELLGASDRTIGTHGVVQLASVQVLKVPFEPLTADVQCLKHDVNIAYDR